MAEGTNSDAAYDVLLKILLIGDSESRKSELLYKYLGVAGEDRSSTTLGESTGEKGDARVKGRRGESMRNYWSDHFLVLLLTRAGLHAQGHSVQWEKDKVTAVVSKWL